MDRREGQLVSLTALEPKTVDTPYTLYPPAPTWRTHIENVALFSGSLSGLNAAMFTTMFFVGGFTEANLKAYIAVNVLSLVVSTAGGIIAEST